MHLAWGTQTPPARCPRVPTAAAMTKLTVSYGQIRTIPNPTGTATFVGLNSRTQSISTQSEPNYRTPNSTPMCTLTHELFRSPWDKRTVWKHYLFTYINVLHAMHTSLLWTHSKSQKRSMFTTFPYSYSKPWALPSFGQQVRQAVYIFRTLV